MYQLLCALTNERVGRSYSISPYLEEASFALLHRVSRQTKASRAKLCQDPFNFFTKRKLIKGGICSSNDLELRRGLGKTLKSSQTFFQVISNIRIFLQAWAERMYTSYCYFTSMLIARKRFELYSIYEVN